jgi:uncharacterized SAM-binding protein YcdF (DUF218 family)
MYKTFVWDVLQPLPIFWLLVALALANLWRRRQETRKRLLLVVVPFLLLTIFSLPIVGALMVGSLERQFEPMTVRPLDAGAIVVLASYVYPPIRTGAAPEMDETSYDRCLKAAEVYRLGPACPIVVSGGATARAVNCALAMRDFLVQLGVKSEDVVVEGTSETTYENAVETSKLLSERGISKIILVTDAGHLLRAVKCFRKQGMEVVPCGCEYRILDFDISLSSFLPQPGAARGCQLAMHEWLGLAWYWLRGRI